MRRATHGLNAQNLGNIISIHALLAESDHIVPACCNNRCRFLSTLSLRRATKRAVRGTMRAIISIHALLAESDINRPQNQRFTKNFYPRSPCGERPCRPDQHRDAPPKFLSTLSLRRATSRTPSARPGTWYFYPRSPCGERRMSIWLLLYRMKFLSTLSLRRATRRNIPAQKAGRFLSTLSLRRATKSAGRDHD